LKAKNKAAKQDYKAAKKEANADLKASGVSSAKQPNAEINSSGK
jgi:hypothetical protein